MSWSYLALYLLAQTPPPVGDNLYFRIPWKSSVDALGMSADGRMLAIGDAEGSVHLWDLALKREIATIREGKRFERIGCIAFADRSTLLFAQLILPPFDAPPETRLTEWDIDKGATKRSSINPGGPLALSADTKKLLVRHGPGGRIMEMLDTATGKVTSLAEDESRVRLRAISHNGSVVCLCNEKSLITVWDVATRKKIASKQLDYLPEYLCVSPSGRYFCLQSR